jgi:membrane glycosyltransferase
VGWSAQERRDSDTTFVQPVRAHGGHTAGAVLLGVIAYFIDPRLPQWLAPSIAGLALSIPISMLSSYQRWGQQAREWGLFLIPEETAPPRLLTLLDTRPGPEAQTRTPALDAFDLAGGHLTA